MKSPRDPTLIARFEEAAILSDYRERGDALWPVFNEDAGKSGTIGYHGVWPPTGRPRPDDAD